MQYICTPKGHKFVMPSTSHVGPDNNWVEDKVCPECHTTDFKEYVESAEVESVFIYELTSGLQVDLNKLLAEGYCIVNRYAKAYHLEKPKAKPLLAEPHLTEAKQAYDKLDGDKP